MTKRCRDTHYYAGGSKIASGSAWVIDPDTGRRLYVVSGRSKVSEGRVHAASLVVGTRINLDEAGTSFLLDPSRLYGRHGRVATGALEGAARRQVVQISSRLSHLLRHGAMTAGISMDEAGWSSRVEVIRVLGCSEAELDAAILHNDKGRFEAFGEFIRAVQGHDLEGTPVALAALEASWVRLDPVGLLYHATRADVADEIAQGGVLARGRTHVHLAAAPDKVATTSGRDEVLIVIDAERLAGYGLDIFRAANGVVLVREVPPGAIVEVRTQGHE